MSFPWDKWDARLRALALEGMAASVIADCLSSESRLPLTRNAVIGRLHRTGVWPMGAGRQKVRKPPRRAAPAAALALAKVKKFTPAKAPLLPKQRKSTPAPPKPPRIGKGRGSLTILTLKEGCCRWIVGDPRTPLKAIYCGVKTVTGQPYCGAHARKAYN